MAARSASSAAVSSRGAARFLPVTGILSECEVRIDFGCRRRPRLESIVDGIAYYIQPGARIPLLDAVIFNVLICNVDAHAKNYSILIGAGGIAKVVPLYDLMCAEVYPRITKLLPQSISGRRDGIHVHGSDWRQLAKQVSLGPARTLKRVAEMCDVVVENADDAKDFVAGSEAGMLRMLDRVVTA